MKDDEKDNYERFFHKLKRVIYQGLLWTAAGAVVGLVYGLIKGNFLKHINSLIYFIGMLMLAYTIIPVEELAMFTRDKDKTYSKRDVEELRKGKRERMNKQLWNFLRTAVVFSVAIIMELIRFRILGGR